MASLELSINGAVQNRGSSCAGLTVPSNICSTPDVCVTVGEELEINCGGSAGAKRLTSPQGTSINNPYSVTVSGGSAVQGAYTCNVDNTRDSCAPLDSDERCVYITSKFPALSCIPEQKYL